MSASIQSFNPHFNRQMKSILALFILLMCSVQNTSYAQIFRHPFKQVQPLDSMQQLEYPFEVKYATLEPYLTVAYADEGKGLETIVFIHGLGSYMPAWMNNISELKSQYRCIAIDLPGYGKSSKFHHSGMMTFYAEVVTKLLDHLNIESAYWAGHSMGGQISMVAALYHPEKVKGLILAAPAGFEVFTPGQRQWFRDVMSVRGVKVTPVHDIQVNLSYNFYNMPSEADFMIKDRIAMRKAIDFDDYCYAIVQSVHGMVDEPVFEFLPKITQPTIVLYGENDNLIPNRYLNPGRTLDIAEAGTAQLPNATLIMIPKTGHFLQFESPAVFNENVKTFIESRKQ